MQEIVPAILDLSPNAAEIQLIRMNRWEGSVKRGRIFAKGSFLPTPELHANPYKNANPYKK